MKKIITHIILITLLSATGCSSFFPKSGPSANQIKVHSRSNQQSAVPKFELIDINKEQNLFSSHNKTDSFYDFVGGDAFNETINTGDLLDISIWEAPPAILFGAGLGISNQAQTTKLMQQYVNKSGRITIPFIGNVNAKGKTTEQLENLIVQKLKKLANQPQVTVKMAQNNSANVTVLTVGTAKRMPLTGMGETILDSLAAVDGVKQNLDYVSVQLTRGAEVKTVPLSKVVSDYRENIRLKTGDVIALSTEPNNFIAMGAVGKNQKIPYKAGGISLAEALGLMGGLLDNRSDSTGVFIFRYQDLKDFSIAKQAKLKASGYNNHSKIPIVFQLNLSNPRSLLVSQHFAIENNDVVYVANAPLSELDKFLKTISSVVNPFLLYTK